MHAQPEHGAGVAVAPAGQQPAVQGPVRDRAARDVPGADDEVGAVENGADLAVGSRYGPGGAIPKWPAHRRALSRWGNRYATAVLRLPLCDATSGYRAYRASALRAIDLDHVRANGYGFLIEMAYRVARQGGTVAEVPIVFTDRERDGSKMSGRIVVEAVALVTLWGVRDLVTRALHRGPAADRPAP